MKKLTSFNPGPGPNSIAGTASTKLLYGSDMDDLTIMLRESVQNSWDARDDSKMINYSLTGLILSDEELANLRNCIGYEPYGKAVVDSIDKKGRTAFQITDTETSGLTGDISYDNNHSNLSRFLKFVFEVGNTQQGSGAGGSFGYGKASLYKLSTVGTVAIYSIIRKGIDFEERFIVKSINRFENFVDASNGVYWWGEKVHTPEDSSCARSILPVTGPEAGNIARSLGMRTPPDGTTGTALFVYAPYLEINSDYVEQETHGFPSESYSDYDKILDALIMLQRTSVHYFWAKYQVNNKGINFEFATREEDKSIKTLEPINPGKVSPYNKLLNCLSVTKQQADHVSADTNRKIIRTNRPKEDLGILSWFEIAEGEINRNYITYFKSFKSQIALMRNIEFVVKYMDVDIHVPTSKRGPKKIILGVYRTLQKKLVYTSSDNQKKIPLEDVYRASENQTHGEWSHENVKDLGGYCTTYVKQTPLKIIEALKEVYPDFTTDLIDAQISPDADNMTFLGQFISGVQGGGIPGGSLGKPKTPSYGDGNGNNMKNKPVLEYIRNTGIQTIDGTIVSGHVFNLKNTILNSNLRLYPICPDEDGALKLKESDNSILPVSISDIRILNASDSRVQKNVNRNGTVTLKSDMTELLIEVKTTAFTDCRYAIDVELLTANN
jgi:hypothetical protein